MNSRLEDCYAVLDDDGTCIGVGVDSIEAMYDAADFLLKTGREVGHHPDGRERITTGRYCTARYSHAVATRPAGVERSPEGRQINGDGLLDLRPQFVRPRERSVRLVVREATSTGSKA